jgi:ribosomal protein L30E
MQQMLKGIAIGLSAGEYINVKIGRAYTIRDIKKGRPKVAIISVNWSKDFFNFTLSS